MIAADNSSDHGAHCEAKGRCVSEVGAGRKEDDADRGKGDGPRTVRPFGKDPEELGGPDHNKGAARIDQRRKPIGYAEVAEAAAARNRPGRIGNEQRQPVERVRDGGQHFRRLIGEQPQRRRARREGDQPRYR